MAVGIGDIWSVQYRGTWHGQRTLTTFTYRADIVTGTPTEAAFATEIDAAVSAAGKLTDDFKGLAPPEYTLDELWVQKLAPTRFAKFIFGKAAPGTYAQSSNVPNASIVITRRGAFARRDNIGMVHMPLANLDPQIANGRIGANLIVAGNALATEMLALITLATLGGLTPVIWHGGTAGNFDTIVTTQTQSTTRVMRRRTVAVGE